MSIRLRFQMYRSMRYIEKFFDTHTEGLMGGPDLETLFSTPIKRKAMRALQEAGAIRVENFDNRPTYLALGHHFCRT